MMFKLGDKANFSGGLGIMAVVTLVDGPFTLLGLIPKFWVIEGFYEHARLIAEDQLLPIKKWVRCEGEHHFIPDHDPGETYTIPGIRGYWEKKINS